MMRRLLIELGYKEKAVCRAYAQAERDGLVPRKRNVNRMTPEEYAAALWANGHRRSNPWIREHCARYRIPH
jgi:hypothetical protein